MLSSATHAAISRRHFFASVSSAAGVLGLAVPGLSWAKNPQPPVRSPRATDGDDRFEPEWEKRFTLTIGNREGDLAGVSDRVIQAGLDYVARMGGGTVQLLPGEFILRNSVILPSRTRLIGSGSETVLTRPRSAVAPLAQDSDWYDQEITLKGASPFQVGDGIVLKAKNPHHGGATVIKRTIVARKGSRLKLNDGLRENLWLSGNPTCESLYPLLTADHAADVEISHLVLDGNRKNVGNLDGNHAGCVFLQDCNRFHLHHLETRHFNGDGISFQICHDVQVEHCHSHNNAGLGVHPGSGSQRPLIRNCRLEKNSIGLFWCWGVKYGLAEENVIHGNATSGISIGHNDTDNVIRRNEITDSGEVGILFRDDSRGQDFWPNRNTVEDNRIINSGGDSGIGIDVRGRTREVEIRGNTLAESREEKQRTGLRIGAEVGSIQLERNRFEGFLRDIHDLRDMNS